MVTTTLTGLPVPGYGPKSFLPDVVLMDIRMPGVKYVFGADADIATRLYMSEATVMARVSRVLTKLGAANRVQVAILVRDAGLA